MVWYLSWYNSNITVTIRQLENDCVLKAETCLCVKLILFFALGGALGTVFASVQLIYEAS